MSLASGSVSAREQYKFRKSNDARIPFATSHGDKPIRMPEESFTYGLQTRPQTPFKGIISGNYGTEASRDLQYRYNIQKELVSLSVFCFTSFISKRRRHRGWVLWEWLIARWAWTKRSTRSGLRRSRKSQSGSWSVSRKWTHARAPSAATSHSTLAPKPHASSEEMARLKHAVGCNMIQRRKQTQKNLI